MLQYDRSLIFFLELNIQQVSWIFCRILSKSLSSPSSSFSYMNTCNIPSLFCTSTNCRCFCHLMLNISQALDLSTGIKRIKYDIIAIFLTIVTTRAFSLIAQQCHGRRSCLDASNFLFHKKQEITHSHYAYHIRLHLSWCVHVASNIFFMLFPYGVWNRMIWDSFADS